MPRKTRTSNGETVITLEWSDAKPKIAEGFNNRFPVSIAGNKRAGRYLFDGGASTGFMGYEIADAKRWFERGYSIDGVDLGNPPIPIRERRRLEYREEGEEIHIDMALSGDENVFSEWTKREVIPGLAIEVEMGFRGSTPAETITDYFKFVCRAVYALETAGVDCEITLTQSSEGMPERAPNKRTKVIVRVKRENEALDFNSFSCLLSPAGKRTFMFALQTLACEEMGEGISSGFGGSTSNGFAVKYDRERGVLRFETLSDGRGFPAERMEAELKSAMQEISKG